MGDGLYPKAEDESPSACVWGIPLVVNIFFAFIRFPKVF